MKNMIKNGTKTIDSRDLAKMVGKTHADLLKMIQGTKHSNGTDHYVGILPTISEKSQGISQEYFIECRYSVEGNKRTCVFASGIYKR